jgi:hypothetical protein
MKKLGLLLPLLFTPTVWAEELEWRKLYVGVGLGSAAITQVEESPSVLQYFIGYPLARPHVLEGAERFRLELEAGYLDVSDYDHDSYWLAPVLNYHLNSELDLLLRVGVEGGDSEGMIGAVGVAYKPDPVFAVRLELVERAASSAIMVNLVYRP